ncbi:MAG: 3-phosphoshikimate 1-carboxyvinyltransferase [Candidatus Eisenbacteria bacterium]|uniref:3-phosphoshikimate 1-carboxyvinyltransferase n=1 Tax=Eiseniibacteriota bacterium TaxID=2212470 RepID=A0A538TN26_UNCEI|nr:MAG: 3-phosphoshikimate 1-carboxyvinyltransferase [Candidatus Eisenbacteria bacterium]
MSRATTRPGRPLRGACDAPGDKSITQRAILLGALAAGETRIVGANAGADALAALGIVRALGIKASASKPGDWRIRGGELRESDRVLDARNSGTALRLSMGLLSAQPFLSILTGDSSLRNRPVARVIEPLRALSADLAARGGDRLPPVVVRGRRLKGATVRTPVASAQVKSAVLLAAIQAEGETVVEESAPTRDHTERMLPLFGCPVAREGAAARVEGRAPLRGAEIRVPGDASAAAFLLAAAALVPGSDLTVRDVGVNPTRRAFLDLLARAGARIELGNERLFGEEPVADVRIRPGALAAFRISGPEAGPLIDELPLVAVLAAFAKGESVIRGAEELRVKESDRIAAVTAGLRAIGVEVEEREDGWTIAGRQSARGGIVDARSDHRIAMAFLIAGLRAKQGVTVDGAESIRVSDPGFLARVRGLAR